MDQKKNLRKLVEISIEKENDKCFLSNILNNFLRKKNEKSDFYSEESTKLINELIHHGRTSCKKCSKESAYLLIGVYHFELFKSRLNKFRYYLITKEMNQKQKQENNIDDNQHKKNCEKYRLDCEIFSTLVNLNSQNKILEYLIKAIDCWIKLLKTKEKVDQKIFLSLDIPDILRSCYFIFSCYGLVKYQKLACNLYLELVLLYGNEYKNHLLFAYYCQIRLYLDFGELEKAKLYLNRVQATLKSLNKNYKKKFVAETILLEICECEYELFSMPQNSKQCAQKLNELLKHDFFNHVTVTSGYIQCLAFYLSTRFCTKEFGNESLFQLFNKPFSFCNSLFNMWYPFINDKESEKKIKINSSYWLEFAIIKFSFMFSITYTYFTVNSCIKTSRYLQFYETVFKISRIYSVLSWCSQLLILSSCYDDQEIKKIKINNAKQMFLKENSSSKLKFNSIKENLIDLTNFKVDNNSCVLINKDLEDLDYLKLENSTCCKEFENLPIYVLKKSLMKNVKEVDDSEFFNLYDYEKEIDCQDNCLIPDLIFIKQEILILLNFYNRPKDQFLSYFKKIDLEKFNLVYFDIISEDLSINRLNINQNYPCSPINLFNIRCLKIYIETIKNKSLEFSNLILNLLKKSDQFKFTYESRYFLGELVVNYIETHLYKLKKSKLKIIEYDYLNTDLSIQNISEINIQVNEERYNLRRNMTKNYAPKKKKNYKMEEIKEYIEELYKTQSSKKNVIKLDFTDCDEDHDEIEVLKTNITKIKSENSFHQTANKFDDGKENYNINKKNFFRSNVKKKQGNIDDELSKTFEELNLTENYSFIINENENLYLEIKRLIENLLELYGNYPPVKVYNNINKIMFKLSILEEFDYLDEAGYYFSEICQANALRYKTIQALEKKRKYVESNFDYKVLEFQNSNKSRINQLNDMLNILPENWRIVQIQFIESSNTFPDLYICKFQKFKKPVFLKISINPNKFTQNFIDDFNEILQLSNASLNEKEKKSFWKLRYALDERLRKLLESVDSTWISCFIGFFMGQCTDEKYNLMISEIEKCIKNFSLKNNLVCLNQDLLRIVCESFPLLNEDKFYHALITLFKFEQNFDNLYLECLSVMKKFIKFNEENEKNDYLASLNFSPLGLITGPTFENFPFESLKSLRILNLQIFRIPSIRFLYWMYSNLKSTNKRIHSGFSDKNVYFLINPSKDLSYTESYFKDRFQELSLQTNWKGEIGKIPIQNEIKFALEKKDVYIYFGHSCGIKYIGNLYEHNVNCLSLVLGCSSAKLSNDVSEEECFGPPYYFLINGCPTYLGCLWNVTDRDIDKYSERLLQHLLDSYKTDENIEKCKSVTKAASLSRDICKLKFLTGSAPVVYGLPINMR